MHSFKTIATVAVFFTSAWAAPPPAPGTTRNANSPAVIFTAGSPGDWINDCGDSSFTNRSSGGSPRVDDCRQIAANINGGGTWEVENFAGSQHQLVQYGTCAFGVQGTGASNSVYFYVGNSDIIDLINSSIDKFQWNGLVGSEGVMNCQPGQDVKWGLYHT